jgi:hypothetical protein
VQSSEPTPAANTLISRFLSAVILGRKPAMDRTVFFDKGWENEINALVRVVEEPATNPSKSS